MQKIFKIMQKNEKKSEGYALLFAVLVSAVVLGVGVSILNISRKELLLTSGAEQSQYAFYAADSGYECALYEDYQNKIFNATTTGTLAGGGVNCGVIYTNGTPTASYASPVTVTAGQMGVGTASYTYTFSVPVSAAGSCAAVTVTKNYTSVTIGTSTVTTASTSVLSDGFNVGWEAIPGDCNALNPLKEERALVANY